MHVSAQALKNKKNPPRKKFLIFQEMKLSSSDIKKILIFSYISWKRNPEKIPYISGNRNPKKASYISRNEILHFFAQGPKKINKNPPRENFLYFRKRNLKKNYYILSRESCSCIPIFQETKNPKKLFIFQEIELTYTLWKGSPPKFLNFKK